MANLLKVQTTGGTILVEVNRSDAAARQVVNAKDLIKDATESLRQGLDKLVACGEDFAHSVMKLGQKVKKAELEIGLELTGEGSFFFASVSGGATFTVKLEFDLTTLVPTPPKS